MNSEIGKSKYKYFGMWPVAPTPFHISFAKKHDLLTYKWGK